MGGTVFHPCYLIWGQTMVEVMKIKPTSFKRSHAHTVTLSAPNPAAGHCWPMPLPETAGHSRASLGQSLVGSLLLSPASWCIQGSVCALPESVSQSCVSSGSSVVGELWPPTRGLMPHPSLLRPEPRPLRQATADRTSSGDAQTQLWLGLCGISGSWCAQVCLSPLSVSGRNGVWFLLSYDFFNYFPVFLIWGAIVFWLLFSKGSKKSRSI